MLKDFLKIQTLVILILILNVIATKNFRIPTQDKGKTSIKKSKLKTESKKKESTFQFTFIKKNPSLQAVLDLNK